MVLGAGANGVKGRPAQRGGRGALLLHLEAKGWGGVGRAQRQALALRAELPRLACG